MLDIRQTKYQGQGQPCTSDRRCLQPAARGFTLVEVITVLVVISLLAAFAAPEVISWRPKMRLKSAAETLAENLQLAKMHAIKNNVSVIFTFNLGAGTPCTGGSYSFADNAVPSNVIASEMITAESIAQNAGICLEAPTPTAPTPTLPPASASVMFVSGVDGFTSRGLPINPSKKGVKLSNANLTAAGDPVYHVCQSVAGGISFTKGTCPP